jgi:hypothetical protein
MEVEVLADYLRNKWGKIKEELLGDIASHAE